MGASEAPMGEEHRPGNLPGRARVPTWVEFKMVCGGVCEMSSVV